MPGRPSDVNIERMRKFALKFCEKSGTVPHPDAEVFDAVVVGLAANVEAVGRPLCPCRFYPDKQAEAQHRTWICACDDMQIYKYCHCLLFVNADGLPITEHLPEDHEGRAIYGVVADPTPDKGRAMRDRAAEREIERKARPS